MQFLEGCGAEEFVPMALPKVDPSGLLHSSTLPKLTWKWRGARFETTIRPSMGQGKSEPGFPKEYRYQGPGVNRWLQQVEGPKLSALPVIPRTDGLYTMQPKNGDIHNHKHSMS